MLDIAAIIVAVISLLASLLVAGATSWSTYSTDKRKSVRDAEILLRKYQDPLLLAARDLQSRLYNIYQGAILTFGHRTPEHKDTLLIYTAFLIGQYFAWIHILQRQGQFIAFTSGGKRLSRTQKFIKITDEITELLNTGDLKADMPRDDERREDRPSDVEKYADSRLIVWRLEPEGLFILWKDHQKAIGEIMTVKGESENELICMGFSEFTRQWKGKDSTLRTWFRTIEEAIDGLVEGTHVVKNAPDIESGTEAENRLNAKNTTEPEVSAAEDAVDRARKMKVLTGDASSRGDAVDRMVLTRDHVSRGDAVARMVLTRDHVGKGHAVARMVLTGDAAGGIIVEAKNTIGAKNTTELELSAAEEDAVNRARKMKVVTTQQLDDLKERLKNLQRLLVDLIKLLDEDGVFQAGSGKITKI